MKNKKNKQKIIIIKNKNFKCTWNLKLKMKINKQNEPKKKVYNIFVEEYVNLIQL